MQTGKVKWYNGQKGYGFIESNEGGGDVFVHVTALQAAGINDLADNQSVSYEIEERNGKTSAINLEIA